MSPQKINRTNHIISTVRWDTAFAQEDTAGKLQQRLANWSNNKMPYEVAGVFDEVCPADEVWSIGSVQLDIGDTDYNDLEFELSLKIRRLLKDKLSSLLISMPKSGNEFIKVTSKTGSLVNLLESYLTNGFFPWYHSKDHGTFNQVMAVLFHEGRSNLLDMIWQEGAVNPHVRKRLAWQLNETNLLAVVQGLEPVFHNQINGFANELVMVQEKEAIVKGTQNNFRRSVYEWILNYLLVEQGSTFNKMTMMQSSIRQMASHYNIAYQDLLELIKLAVLHMLKCNPVKADFLCTLQSLFKVIPGDSDASTRLANKSIKTQHGPAKEKSQQEVINFFLCLCSFAKLTCDYKETLIVITSFLRNLNYTDGPWPNKVLVDRILTVLAERNHLDKLTILRKLILAEVPSKAKTTSSLLIHNLLSSIYADKIKNTGQHDHYKECIALLCQSLESKESDKNYFLDLLSELKKHIWLHPKLVLTALVNYQDKASVRKLLKYLPDEYVSKLLHAHPQMKNLGNISADDVRLTEMPQDKAQQILLISVIDKNRLNDITLSSIDIENAIRQESASRIVGDKTWLFTKDERLSIKNILLLLEMCLDNGRETIQYGDKKFHVRMLLAHGLELSPSQVLGLIKKSSLSESRLESLLANISFSEFIVAITSEYDREDVEAMEAIRSLYELTKKMVNDKTDKELLRHFRQLTLRSIRTGVSPHFVLQELVHLTLKSSTRQHNDHRQLLIKLYKKNDILITPYLRKELVSCDEVFSVIIAAGPSERLSRCVSKGLLEELMISLIRHKKIPSWFETGNQSMKELLNEIVLNYPSIFIRVLKHEVITATQKNWLTNVMAFPVWKTAVAKIHPGLESQMLMLGKLYDALGHLSVGGISAKQLQDIVCRKFIKAWETGKWQMFSPANLWNELIWDCSIKHGVSGEALLQGISKISNLVPAKLRTSFARMVQNQKVSFTKKKNVPAIIKKSAISQPGITVYNAGIVILSSYIPLLFQRMEIMNGNQFKDDAAKSYAVHYLQYLATGISYTEEPLLPLNKVLCGIPMEAPVSAGFDISATDVTVIEGLINTVIGYWPAIGDCTLDGFRGNWLVREGTLAELDDKWVLTVEKRAYDLLISRSPFSFGIIRFPWMSKLLQVNWSF